MSNFSKDDTMAELAQYFNIDQAASASQSQNGKTIVSPPQFTAPGPEAAFVQPQHHISHSFQGPSHQYELFRQHSSLPPGAMNNVMQQRPRQMISQNFGVSSNNLYEISEMENNPNMDIDLSEFIVNGSPLEGYVDPNSVTGSEMGDASPVTAPAQRVYPGSHQQAAKAQQEHQRRAQEQHHKVMVQPQQRPLPQQPQHSQHQQRIGHQRRSSQGRTKPVDPLVEEQISQILRRIRADSQNTRSAPSATPQPVLNQTSRLKKDEEDMDDDEKLLASEEGKKLSSKERRQLRNKVSARAFRSRRKEYINQLEGEINGKNSENDDLRGDNEMLRKENSQLTDLVRMLLGQPAFNSVLEDLSSRGAQNPFLPTQSQAQSVTQQQQQARPQQASQQQQQQHRASIAMSQASAQSSASQPTSNAMDFANTPIDGWSTGLGPAEFNFNPNVFSVTKIPQHPAIEPEVLAGKSHNSALPLPFLPHDEKNTSPVASRCLKPGKTEHPVISSSEESGANSPRADFFRSRLAPSVAGRESNKLEYISSGKAPRFQLVSFDPARDTEAALESRFAILCDRLDAVSRRISSITGDL